MFNNSFPPTFNPIGDMVWINSKEELQALAVPPNKQKVFFLRDANNPIFYVVSANDIGMTSITQYRFEEVVEPKPEERFVTRDEFEKLMELLGEKGATK